MSNAWLREVRYRESAGKRRAALSAPRRGPHPPVASPPPSEMVVDMLCVLSLAAAIAIATAHPHSHDNILRVQLWDAEGLSREPVTVHVTSAPVLRPPVGRSSRVDSRVLYEAMLEEGRGWAPGGRSSHHRVRHKRRRTRRSGEPASPPWQFHAGSGSINVVSYEEDEPPPEPAGDRDAGAPQRQRAADEPAPDEKVSGTLGRARLCMVIVASRWLMGIHALIAGGAIHAPFQPAPRATMR
ncbi:hypothetical protein EVAR_53237_1 [Eumeta japonica]|uniref:Uncharacterized protein n=1 Tax=Eumeta variegata TaxID=151549 RepID=A0A4C1XEB5_EUMVA|nr:hypothetical protein EVAR_53237_1 [Eumeta japonica]